MVDDVIKLINDLVVQYQEVQQPETISKSLIIGFANANDEKFKTNYWIQSCITPRYCSGG